MKHLIFVGSIMLIFASTAFSQGNDANNSSQQISIEWLKGKPDGIIEVLNGEISDIKITRGKGKAKENKFEFRSEGNNCLQLNLKSIQNEVGTGATLVTVNTKEHPFSFFLRDVNKEFPILIPEYQVVVLRNGDARSYEEVEAAIKGKNLLTNLERIENEQEESFEAVKNRTRNQSAPTWLGISRDMRIFQISQALVDAPDDTDIITPKNSSQSLHFPETDKTIHYLFTTGRGQGVEINTERRLEDGVLPILHSSHIDGEIRYHSIAFTSLEYSPLNEQTPIGTDFLVADNYSAGHMFTDEQKGIVNKKLEEIEKANDEQTVLYCQIIAKNTGQVPRYAWYKTPKAGKIWDRINYEFDKKTGFSQLKENQIFCISKLNGKPLPNEEMAILLKPNETAIFAFYIPHTPITEEKALNLSKQSFNEKYSEIKEFWKTKLDKAARIRLPEKRIEEMIQAGLLHLDLITYGKEPNGTLAPLIGVYSPIGTESSPIVQFYCSMGLHEIAKRSLMYFLDKQHDDGLIQNFGDYMVETGAALWSMGEYFRYSNDSAWVKQVKPKLLKSCDYLINWREQNKREELKSKGYGMIDGKVADPEDPYHQYMLNAYAYLGIKRVSEMLYTVDPANSIRLKKEAENWKQDILKSFRASMAHSPVVPLGDGTWCPTVPPWTEAVGPRSLYVNEETFFSHGTFTVPDVLLGPLYLVFCEVLDATSTEAKMMLDYHSELFYQNNSVFSQPYYSRHNWVQLKQGLVKPFLKTYYNTFSALADRETYTFWEHLYHVSPHKTHEEGWFLMETRWMLYMEEGQTLNLLPGIPRKWLGDGEKIELDNVVSYFGPVSLVVGSHVKDGYIEASIQCGTEEKPKKVVIRLPHPNHKKAVNVEGGIYNEETETVTIESFNGKAFVRIEF